MPTERQDLRGEIAIPALAKFAEHLQLNCMEVLTGIFYQDNNFFLKKVPSPEARASLFIESLIHNDKNQLIDFLGQDIDWTDSISIADMFQKTRSLKNKLTNKISSFTNDVGEAIALMTDIDALFLSTEDGLRNKINAELKEPYRQLKHFNDRITNTIPGIIFILDLFKFKEVYINRNAESFFGYSHQDLQEIGSDLMSRIIHPEDAPMLLDKVGDFANSREGEIRIYEFRVKTKAGNYSWVRSYESIYKRTAKGVPRQVIGIAIDISKEKETSKQLEHRQQQLLHAQQLAGIGHFEVEMDTYSGEITDLAKNILQLQEGQSLAMFLDNVHEEDQQRIRENIQEAIDTQSEYDLEFRYKSDGGYKAIWLKGNVHKNDKKLLIKGTVLDITTRYQLLQQLKKSEQLYKQAEALSHIGNWSWELKNNTFLLSDEVYRIFEIPGLPVKFDRDDFINNLIPSERPHIEHIIREAISHRRSLEFTLKYKVSAAVIKTVKVLGEVTYDEHIHSIIIIGTCQDISVQQEIEHKLRMNKAELEQSNMSLREYAYVASHDLQEPLRKISTFADRLRTSHEAELSEQAKSHLSKIISSSIRMQQMIRDLLSVSIINSERSFESVNMDKLFQEVLQHFEDIIEHKKITITADRLPEATVIPSQIRQLFQNLISNSIKFSHPQIPCHIKLTTSLIEDPGDDIKNLIPGRNYLKIMISDNGIGFNNQFAEKIFTIFQRLHRKQEFDGTGIGLAICRRIAENHNGMIKAFGEEGKGAVFTIIIPA